MAPFSANDFEIRCCTVKVDSLTVFVLETGYPKAAILQRG